MACFSGSFCLTCTALCTAALTFQQCLCDSTAALQVMAHNLTTTLHEHCSTARSGPPLPLCTLPPHSTHAPPTLTQHLPCCTARSGPHCHCALSLLTQHMPPPPSPNTCHVALPAQDPIATVHSPSSLNTCPPHPHPIPAMLHCPLRTPIVTVYSPSSLNACPSHPHPTPAMQHCPLRTPIVTVHSPSSLNTCPPPHPHPTPAM